MFASWGPNLSCRESQITVYHNFSKFPSQPITNAITVTCDFPGVVIVVMAAVIVFRKGRVNIKQDETPKRVVVMVAVMVVMVAVIVVMVAVIVVIGVVIVVIGVVIVVIVVVIVCDCPCFRCDCLCFCSCRISITTDHTVIVIDHNH